MALLRTHASHFPTFFDDFLSRDGFFGQQDHRVSTPAVNISEDDELFKVEMAAPGMQKKDFNVSVEHDMLTISYEKEEQTDQEQDNYSKREFNYTSFQRSFNLPDTVNADNISASYKNGILMLTIPKKEDAKKKPKRLININ